VEIPKARPAGETHAYSLEEEVRMLAILPEPAATIVANSPPKTSWKHLRECLKTRELK
jgi:hypothetical protein